MPVIRGLSNWGKSLKANDPSVQQYGNYSIKMDIIEHEPFIKFLKDNRVKAQIQEVNHTKTDEVHGEDVQYTFTFRLATERKDGTINAPPVVVDAKRNPLPDDVGIGNGSEVIVQYDTYTYDGGAHTAIVLSQVQVLNLIPYTPKNTDEFEEQEGYVADTSEDAVI